MKKTIREMHVVEIELESEDPSERQAEISRLKQMSNGYAEVVYSDNNGASQTARIGFATDNPEILKVILNN